VQQGDAVQILLMLARTFDLIFVDLVRSFPDAESAPRLLSLCLPCLRPGGLLITDNALHVGPSHGHRTPTQEGIRRYNRAIADHPDLEGIVLPLRDGVSVARKRLPEEGA
jgi:predicted O-methyltransferase YrrM